jgi:hypothetical protein
MKRYFSPIGLALLTFASLSTLGCESRQDKLARELAYQYGEKKKADPSAEVAAVPADPMRESLRPVLEALYSGTALPDVLDADIIVADAKRPYQLTAGVLAQIRLPFELRRGNKARRVRGIVTATAEADAWVFRKNARKDYAEHINKLTLSFDEAIRDQVLAIYADLKLLEFFSNAETDALIEKLPADVKPGVVELSKEYKGQSEAIWNKWMEVKMMARREVASDQPFRPVLKRIRKELGRAEPDPIAFATAHDTELAAWGEAVNKDDSLMKLLTNLNELRDQEEFRNDTHALWLLEGSERIPAKASKVKIDKDVGFGVYRDDLGMGYNEFVFVFPNKAKDSQRKRAYLKSHIYRHMFNDYQMLATAGTDFEGGTVPDKYDEEYARCGSEAAIDALVAGYKGKFPLIGGMKESLTSGDKRLKKAHKCIIDRCSPDIANPDEDDPRNVEGPAPSSRLAFFQMMARFENEISTSAMRKTREKSDAVKDAEAFLNANKNSQR